MSQPASGGGVGAAGEASPRLGRAGSRSAAGVAAASPPPAKRARMSDAEVVDLTLDSDEECGAAKGGAAAPAPAAARRRAHAFAGSQEEDVVIVSEKPGSPTRVAARKAAESCLDLTVEEDVGRLIGGVPKDPAAAAARLLQRTQELERELLEARKHAQRHAGPGVQAPAHWKLQQQARGDSHRDENLQLRELPLPSVFDAAPCLPSAKREAVRCAEASEARRLLARFAEPPGGLHAHAISKIWRVQNRRLWSRYVDRRGEVAEEVARHGGLCPVTFALTPSEQLTDTAFPPMHTAAGERLLFHGADPGTIATIVTGGFECRIASMGGALGAGAYFAENASYSNQYSKMPPHAAGPAGAGAGRGHGGRGNPAHAPGVGTAHHATREMMPQSGQLLMIIARVSLGRTGAAASQARIAPQSYQSVGDGAGRTRSQIYAVFDNFQAYPEYVLQYDPARVGVGASAGVGAGSTAMAAAMAAAAAAGLGGVPGFPSTFPGFAAMAAGLWAPPPPRPRKRSRRGY